MRLAIGVMGSAAADHDPATLGKLVGLGRAIAESGSALITGGCPGLPQAAVQGAKGAGGLVVGISPALSAYEHVQRYGSPLDGYDLMVYTGSGLMGREVENIHSSDMVVIAGGRSGTLGEFAIAYDEGRLIGILSGTGGIADAVDKLVRISNKETGAVIIKDDDPQRLIERLLAYYRTEHYKRPNCFCPPLRRETPVGTAAEAEE